MTLIMVHATPSSQAQASQQFTYGVTSIFDDHFQFLKHGGDPLPYNMPGALHKNHAMYTGLCYLHNYSIGMLMAV